MDFRTTTAAPTVSRRFYAVALMATALSVYLCYLADRERFTFFIAAYGLFFALYAWVCFFQKRGLPVPQLIALGVALRVILLFSLPNLSDDYLRFIWDGRLTLAGYHPFLHPPDYFMGKAVFPAGIDAELYGRLNSPHYFSVYPPVCQAVFALAAWIGRQNIHVEVVVMKLFLLACEMGTIRLLRHFDEANPVLKKRFGAAPAALLYALNPLIILEVSGNCHFEGAMIFFLLAGVIALQQGKLALPAGMWALATASKMLPLLFLPLVWRWLGWRKGLVFLSLFGIFTLLLFSPLLSVLPNIAQSIGLYFQKFQFNASIYYLIREIGYSKTGWDIGESSGPWLALATLAGVLAITAAMKSPSGYPVSRLAAAMLFSLLLYLGLSAVVQPWYVCVPLAVSLLTRYRYAVLWSGLAALSYSHYNAGLRQEHFGLIALEYSALYAFLIAEWGVRSAE